MVQIDVPVAFAVGSLFADAAGEQLRTGHSKYFYQALAENNIYQALFFSWIPLYFLVNYFGWETTYMWWPKGSVTAYPLYIPIFTAVFFLAANLGYLLGSSLVRAGKVAANRVVYLVILFYAAVWILAQPGRSMHVGSYEQWRQGLAPWFYQDRTFLIALIFTVIVWAVSLLLFCRRLFLQGKQIRSTAP